MENESILAKANLANVIIKHKAEELKKIAKDYSIWDDAYVKIDKVDKKWFKENYSDWIPKNFAVDIIILADKKASN